MLNKAVVTGYAGFIGSRITTTLLDAGVEVVGVDSFDDLLYSSQIKSRRADEMQRHPGFVEVSSHSTQKEFTQKFRGADCIINEAGLPGQVLSWEFLSEYSESNLVACSRFVRAAIDAEVSHFIQASTSSVYGKNATGAEQSPLRPCSPYGVTKLAAENLLRTYDDLGKINLTVLRYFSVYGPGQRPDMAISRFLRAIVDGEQLTIYGDGTQVRDFTYVDEIVDGTIQSAVRRATGTFNLCSGNPVLLRDVIAICEEVVGREASIKYEARTIGDQDVTAGDNQAARDELGFNPNTSLRNGILHQFENLLRAREL